MFPIRDENPTVRRPIATLAIIGLNVAAWVLIQGMGADVPLARSLCELGLIPGELLGSAPIGTAIPLGGELQCILNGSGIGQWTLLTHMFLHGGWFHIIANLWFLWVFGDNIEDIMGPVRFAAFYLLCGLAAAALQIASDADTLVPMVGASGAIGGVMGAYLRKFPRAYVHTAIFLGFYFTTVAVPAFAILGYWFVLQVINGLPALGTAGGGVAFWAHVGGFAAGFLTVDWFARPEFLADRYRQTPHRDATHRWF